MAWASKEEEAMNLVRLHMGVMKDDKKKELNLLYTRLIFPRQGNAWTNTKWVSLWGVTFVTMWDEEHLLKNIKFAMIQEMMGIGPKKYCIINNGMPNFVSKLLLLINYLPHKKMCFYPHRFALKPPFHLSPWREIGEAMMSRRYNMKNPLLRTLYFTQQFVIFQRTGLYGPTYWI